MRRSFRVVLVILAAGTTLLAVVAAVVSPGLTATPRAALAAAVVSCPDFPADNYWHADVSGLPVHFRSDSWLSHMQPNRILHPDFGMPITQVGSSHPTVDISFEYDGLSDHRRYPLGPDTRIEGGRHSTGDRHAVVVDQDACRLYETWKARQDNKSSWHARSGAAWDLASNDQRPDGRISAEVSGLPLLPGLLRWREVRDGTLDHAIGISTSPTSRWHVWPARHDAGTRDSRHFPPMGARFRLTSSFDESGYSDEAKTVIEALKRYGVVVVAKGAPWTLLGEQNRHWPASLIDEIETIPGGDFQAVDHRLLKIRRNSAQAQVPCGSSAPDRQDNAARVCR